MQRWFGTGLFLLFFLPLTAALLAFSIGPLPQHTGGFQEATCVICHVDYPLNQGRTMGGDSHIEGVPRTYTPGVTYPLRVVIGQPGQSRWGFQLTARFVSSGGQAGRLLPADDLTQLAEADGIQYIQHTDAGTRQGTKDGPVEFRLLWEAPRSGEAVLFNGAGNAADGSGDPTGDYIYTAGAYSGSAMPELSEGPQPRRERPQPPMRRNVSSRFLHIPAPVNLAQGDLEIHIEHRFLRPLNDSSPGNAFGIDSGANINLGLNYALTDRWSVGVSRTRFDQIIVFNGTYEIRTDPRSWWQMALHAGVEGQRNFEEHYSPYLQLATSFDYDRLRLYAAPTVIFNSRRDRDLAFRLDPINPEDNHTWALGLGADLALNRTLSFSAEYVPRLSGFGGFLHDDPTLGGGLKIRSWGHVFTVVASTSRVFTPSGYGLRGEREFSLGFNIYRRIRR